MANSQCCMRIVRVEKGGVHKHMGRILQTRGIRHKSVRFVQFKFKNQYDAVSQAQKNRHRNASKSENHPINLKIALKVGAVHESQITALQQHLNHSYYFVIFFKTASRHPAILSLKMPIIMIYHAMSFLKLLQYYFTMKIIIFYAICDALHTHTCKIEDVSYFSQQIISR